MPVSSNDCKKAIVDFLSGNPGYVSREFGDVPPKEQRTFEADSLKTSNWKRRDKSRDGKFTVREFDCVPYDDQLRAYTWDDGSKIVGVKVEGE